MKNTKVLILGPTPPPHGGIATYCKDILSSNLNLKYDLSFFDITIPFNYRPKFSTNNKVTNIFLRDGLFNSFKQIFFVLINFLSLFLFLLRKRLNIIHIISCTGLGFWRNGVFILISKIFKIKSVFHVVGEIDVFWKKSGSLKRYFISYFLNMSNIIVVQSDGIKDKVSRMTNTKIISIINGVDVSLFKPKKGKSKSEIFNITTLGVLGRRKGYFDIIHLAEILKKLHFNDIKFNFVGGGDVDVFKKIILKNGLSNIINIHTDVSNKKKIEILQNSDIFLLPTYNEGQPISIIEAFCCGLPIISTTVGAIPEIISDKSGFLIEPGDITKLKEIILQLYNNRPLIKSISDYNILKSNEKFSLNRVFFQLDEVYTNCS